MAEVVASLVQSKAFLICMRTGRGISIYKSLAEYELPLKVGTRRVRIDGHLSAMIITRDFNPRGAHLTVKPGFRDSLLATISRDIFDGLSVLRAVDYGRGTWKP